MVYFAADNNLDANAMRNLYDMWQFISAAASDERIHLVAQIDRAPQNIPTTRYHFTGGDKGSVKAYAVEELGETNSGSAEALVDFVQWAVETRQLRAQRYMLVLWGHGKALDDGDGCDAAPQPTSSRLAVQGPLLKLQNLTREISALDAEEIRDILSGIGNTTVFGPDVVGPDNKPAAGSTTLGINNLPPDSLNNQELKRALADIREILGKKLDVLGMDACLMGLAEFYFQVRESVDYAVGSQETIPTDSWPYQPILKTFNTRPDAATPELAGEIVRHYVEHYKQAKPGASTTLSACDLSKFDGLQGGVSDLGATLARNLTDEVMMALAKARRRTQSFFVKDYVDLVDFCEKLREECDLQIVKDRCGAVIDAVQEGRFVISTAASMSLEKTAHGISIYLPTITSCYVGLDFSRATQWDEFLFAFMSRALNRTPLPTAGDGAGTAFRAMTPGGGASTPSTAKEIKMSTKVIVIAVTDRMGINDPKGNSIPFDAAGRNFVLVPAESEIFIPADSFLSTDSKKISEGTSTKTDAEVAILHDTVSPFLQLPAGTNLLDLNTGNFPPLPEGTRLNSTDGTPITVPPATNLKAIS
jgi:hypothetical protein